jgi:hypothetical protein
LTPRLSHPQAERVKREPTKRPPRFVDSGAMKKTRVLLAAALACSCAIVAATSSTAGVRRAAIDVGKTVLLAPRTKASGCRLGANPDRACSPGAYYGKLTKTVIWSPGFRTGDVRNVPQSEKFTVEREYGLTARHYGRTLEIDHIVSLELGGSNDIANLFPEEANAHPGYKAKDRLENRLADMVCRGAISLRAAQKGIAANWQRLYKKVFGARPVG